MKNFKKLSLLLMATVVFQAQAKFAANSQAMLLPTDEATAEQIEQLRNEVYEDIIDDEPGIGKKIAREEGRLATLDQIQDFIQEKNHEIKKLMKKVKIPQIDVAKIAIQLADAQTKFDDLIQQPLSKHKKALAQVVHTALDQVQESLKALNERVQQLGNSDLKQLHTLGKKVRSHASKAAEQIANTAQEVTDRIKNKYAAAEQNAQDQDSTRIMDEVTEKLMVKPTYEDHRLGISQQPSMIGGRAGVWTGYPRKAIAMNDGSANFLMPYADNDAFTQDNTEVEIMDTVNSDNQVYPGFNTGFTGQRTQEEFENDQPMQTADVSSENNMDNSDIDSDFHLHYIEA